MDVSVLRRDDSGSLSARSLLEVEEHPSDIAVADLDGADGDDIAVAFWPSSDVLVYWNDGENAFPERTTVRVGSSPMFVDAADLNNDRKKEQ